jgi:hypothetical protein
MFRTVPLSIIKVFHCTHSNGICRTGLQTVCEQHQDGKSWFCSQTVSKPVWHIPLLCVQWKTPDDGQRNCPKHVESHSKNKCEKLVDMVGLIIRILALCTFTWTSNLFPLSNVGYVYYRQMVSLYRRMLKKVFDILIKKRPLIMIDELFLYVCC